MPKPRVQKRWMCRYCGNIKFDYVRPFGSYCPARTKKDGVMGGPHGYIQG